MVGVNRNMVHHVFNTDAPPGVTGATATTVTRHRHRTKNKRQRAEREAARADEEPHPLADPGRPIPNLACADAFEFYYRAQVRA